jgi:hypothetical protein
MRGAFFAPVPHDEHCAYCKGECRAATLAPDMQAIYCISLQEQPHRTAQAVAHFHRTGLCRQVIFSASPARSQYRLRHLGEPPLDRPRGGQTGLQPYHRARRRRPSFIAAGTSTFRASGARQRFLGDYRVDRRFDDRGRRRGLTDVDRWRYLFLFRGARFAEAAVVILSLIHWLTLGRYRRRVERPSMAEEGQSLPRAELFE